MLRQVSFKFSGYVFLFIFSFTLPAFSQLRWERTYGGSGNDCAFSVKQTLDGGYIFTGYSNGDVYLVKVNASGDTLWTRTYGGSGLDWGRSVCQTTDGGYIVAGYTESFGAGNFDFYLIKTNSQGDTLWTRTFGGVFLDEAFDVDQTTDGGYIITGITHSFGAGWNDVYLVKTNSLGDTLWTRTYGGPMDDEGYSVQPTRDGGYIITGRETYYVRLTKTDNAGNMVWDKFYGGPIWNVGLSVQQTTDKGYIIAGYYTRPPNNDEDFYLIKTDSLGDSLWSKRYGEEYSDNAHSVQQTNDGGYIVAGILGTLDKLTQVYLIKTNGTGDTIWSKTWGGMNYDEGFSVQQTFDGGFIVAGQTNSFGAGGFDVYLIKTDPNGSSAIEGRPELRVLKIENTLYATPNPFTSFASVPGHASERFALYDISGRKVGVYRGDRVGEGLSPGVYFLRPFGGNAKPLRIVKLR